MNAPTQTWPAVSLAEAHRLLTRPGSRFEMEEVLIEGRKTRMWKHAPPTMREVFLMGRSYGAREFLVYEEERVSFEAFARASLAIAAELQAQGVAKGDRVAIVMRNLPEWPAIFFGTILAGAIVTPLNAWWSGPELAYGLSHSGAKVAFADAERWERIADARARGPALETVYVTRAASADPRFTRLEDLIGRPADWGALPEGAMPDVPLAPDNDAAIIYTSGTTGKPKGALATHRGIITNIFAVPFIVARNFVRRGETPPAPGSAPPRIVLFAIPFFHVTGCFAILPVVTFAGGKLVMMRKFEPKRALELIEKERAVQVGGVPAIAIQVLEHPERAKYDLSSLDTISYGGAPSPPGLAARIKEVTPGAVPGFGWGMTETSAMCINNSGEDYLNRPQSCGVAFPVCDIKIMSLDGARQLPVGEVGELWARGPNIVKGYWNDPEATAATFVDGWLRTGDLAYLDEEGFCYVVDRVKDMVIRGGENIYCIEVENALAQHPAVLEAALVPIPHPTLGEEPGAVVHLRAGTEADEDTLRRFAAGRLAAFKVPVRIVISPAPLPRNANGKIVKAELRRMFLSSP